MECVLSRSRDRPQGREGSRLRWLGLVLLALLSTALAQSTGAGREAQEQRERWFLRGRSSSGVTGAGQRYRAYLQKMRMRAGGRAREGAASPPIAVVWSPLGPVPLASDASGAGEDDYGWVSGRATAVAIDPADPTANTVYIGGAYGGVWKSTNATQAVTKTSSSVTWT